MPGAPPRAPHLHVVAASVLPMPTAPPRRAAMRSQALAHIIDGSMAAVRTATTWKSRGAADVG
jgi:hypothetical protein